MAIGMFWVYLCYYSAHYTNNLPYVIVGSIAGAFYGGYYGFVFGSFSGMAALYCIESNSRVLNDLICLPLALLFVIIVGTQIDKWKKRKKLHGTHNGEDKDADSIAKR